MPRVNRLANCRLPGSGNTDCEIASLPCLNDYYKSRTTLTTLIWTQSIQSKSSDNSVPLRLHLPSYRQTLSQRLKLKSDEDNISSLASTKPPSDATVETYLLACCTPSCQDLVRILLHAGANPMVEVGPEGTNGLFSSRSFWDAWLDFLLVFRLHYVELHGRSGGIVLDNKYLDRNITPQTLFNTTKALLKNGADVNFQSRVRIFSILVAPFDYLIAFCSWNISCNLPLCQEWRC